MIRYDFSGKVALVTGGSSGIGFATAQAFGKAGASVVLAARGEEAGVRAEAALRREGIAAAFVACDVRDEASVAELVRRTTARFGRLDVALNAAGAGGDMAPLERADTAVWDDVFANNARGVWLALRYEIPAMLANAGGSIVNMSSIYGVAGKPAHHAYVASKHAVVGLTRSVALEYATRGVRINAVCAGATLTESMRAAHEVVPEVVGALIAEHPMKRLATTSEIADAVLWLCSDASSYVTGSAVAVDGGFLAA